MVLPLGITVSMFANIDAAFSGKAGRQLRWSGVGCFDAWRALLLPLRLPISMLLASLATPTADTCPACLPAPTPQRPPAPRSSRL